MYPHKTIGDRIIVDVTAPKKTSGGLIIPMGQQREGQRGWVLAVGEGVKHVKPGECVLFGTFSGVDFDHHLTGEPERMVKVIREEDVLIVLGDTVPSEIVLEHEVIPNVRSA